MSEGARASVFERLMGEWKFEREVPGKATITGRARIVSTGEGWARYEESARVRLSDGTTMAGSQSYLYRRLAQPANGFDVLFAESGELFERLEFHAADGVEHAAAEHKCGGDRYVSKFSLDAEDRLNVEHKVTGLKKNYVVRTAYRRSGRASGPAEGAGG